MLFGYQVLDALLYLQLSAVDEPVSAGGRAKARKAEKKKDMVKLSKKQRKVSGCFLN